MSPPSLNPCNDLQHTLLQAFPELQLLWGKKAITAMSHQPLDAMKGMSMSGTNMSHYGPNATTMEILREQRAKKRQVQNVTLHSPVIVLLYSQTILAFTPSSLGTLDDLF